jgi:chorismate dehydratase
MRETVASTTLSALGRLPASFQTCLNFQKQSILPTLPKYFGPFSTCVMRIGAVNYLNTKPLIYGLGELLPHAEIVLDIPSRLAESLAVGMLDVALIPVIEYFRGKDYRLVPDISIASEGAVLSVTLFSRVPWPRIRRVALDEGSRTSAALTRVLLSRRFGVVAETVPLAMETEPDLLDVDAVLLIGDRAMRACLPGFDFAFDLGQEWYQWTGLPFVYAVWAIHPACDAAGVPEALIEARRLGMACAGKIAHAEAGRLGLDAGFCRRYLSHILDYHLGQRELAGLNRFYDLASDLGLVPRGVNLEFHNSGHFVQSR